jgi:molybdopterin-guanine dinucleotide biosynthesis protein A
VKTACVLLAGGRARRLGGGDKSLRSIAGRPILAHVIDRVRPQVAALALNANGDPARFAGFGLPVIADTVNFYPGPLAGILAGMGWALGMGSGFADLLSVPTDTPFLPPDLAIRLEQARAAAGAEIAIAGSGGRTHPTVALWPLRLAPDLRQALLDEGERKVEGFARRYRVAVAEFAREPLDPFYNINRPDELEEAERLADRGASADA